MKATLYVLIVLVLVPIFSLSSQPQDLSGIWTGKLDLPNSIKLTIVFNIAKGTNDIYSTTMDSPDQGAKGIPTESTTITEDSILIKIPVVQGYYAGMVYFNEKKIEGQWVQGGVSFDLVINKVDKIEAPKRPQEPKEPFSYKSEDVTFKNTTDTVTLAGTLTLPQEGNNFAVVILISGSGGQDRNEELLGHKPFLVIADYLTRNGIAVLRVDDRGIGQSTGDRSTATSEDYAKDVLAAVDYLTTRNEINHSKIGLIGHSEGGLIAPMVAVQSDDVAFIVLMAGTGVAGDSILILQSELIQKAEGTSDEEIQKALKTQREIYPIIKSEMDNEVLKKQIHEILNAKFSVMSDEERKKFGDLEVFINMQIKTLTSSWFKYFIKYNPAPTLEQVKCPVLAINGEKDLQVPPKENLSAIENALIKAGNKNYEIKMLPGLNHLFQTIVLLKHPKLH